MTHEATQGVELDSELKRHCKLSLPNYMVPSHFCVLEALPLSDNGKVARKQLPKVTFSMVNNDLPLVAAEGETEQRLLAIWLKLLSLEQLSVEENFFDIYSVSCLCYPVVKWMGRHWPNGISTHQ